MTIKPYGDYLLVRPVEKAQVLVSDDGTLSEYGEVIAKGPACSEAIKIGEKVGFSVFGVEKLIIEEEKFYFVRESTEFLLATIQD